MEGLADNERVEVDAASTFDPETRYLATFLRNEIVVTTAYGKTPSEAEQRVIREARAMGS